MDSYQSYIDYVLDIDESGDWSSGPKYPHKNQYFIFDDGVVLVKLTCDQHMLMDEDELHLLEEHCISAHWDPCTSGYYAYTGTDSMKFHRIIMNAPTDLQVDHINRCTLDNRKINLRCVNRSVNGHNKGTYKNNTSGHKGISFEKDRQVWKAYIRVNNQLISERFLPSKYGSLEFALKAAIEWRKNAEIYYMIGTISIN